MKRSRLVVFAIAAAVACLFLIDVCNLIYQCGCRSLWNEADRHCNVHKPFQRHCPLCESGPFGFGAFTSAIVGVQAAVAFGPWPWTSALRLWLALAAFPLTALLLGVPLGVWRGYW